MGCDAAVPGCDVGRDCTPAAVTFGTRLCSAAPPQRVEHPEDQQAALKLRSCNSRLGRIEPTESAAHRFDSEGPAAAGGYVRGPSVLVTRWFADYSTRLASVAPTEQAGHELDLDDSSTASGPNTPTLLEPDLVASTASLVDCKKSWSSVHRNSKYHLLDTGSACLEKQRTMQELITFHGCGDLLRGVRLSVVMRMCGSVFRNSEGSASTFDLSEEVDELDSFLSHNWSVSRFKKYVALAYHFYFDRGVMAAVVVMLLVATLSVFGFVPTVYNQTEDGFVGLLGRCLCLPSCCLAVLLWPEIVDRCGHGGPRVFLDKVCIHQTDADRKMRGIRKLGAFIAMSNTMIVLYGNEYLNKLWTVFELASFLAVHRPENLRILPITVSLVVSIFVVVVWLRAILGVVVGSLVVFPYLNDCLNLAGGIILFVSFEVMYKSRASARLDFQQFSVAKARCFLESDRPIICEGIARTMKVVLDLPMATPQGEVLEAFDDFVRVELPTVVDAQIGAFWFSHARCLVLSFLIHGPELVDLLPLLADRSRYRGFWLDVLRLSSWLLALTPLAMMLMQMIADSTCLWRGRWAALGTAGGVLFIAGYVGAASLALGSVRAWALASNAAVALVIVADALLFGVAKLLDLGLLPCCGGQSLARGRGAAPCDEQGDASAAVP